jgi:hypothetical protein
MVVQRLFCKEMKPRFYEVFMKKCSNDCFPLCDYCIYYHDNEYEGHPKFEGMFEGEGTCSLFFEYASANDGAGCEGFHCSVHETLK